MSTWSTRPVEVPPSWPQRMAKLRLRSSFSSTKQIQTLETSYADGISRAKTTDSSFVYGLLLELKQRNILVIDFLKSRGPRFVPSTSPGLASTAYATSSEHPAEFGIAQNNHCNPECHIYI